MSNRIKSSQEVDNEDLLVDAKKRVPPVQRHEKVALIEPPAGTRRVETDVFGGGEGALIR